MIALRAHDSLKTNHLARASRIECLAVLGAIVLSPLWFVNFFGVNFGPPDILLVFAYSHYIYRTRTLPLLPSRLAVVGVAIFLITGLISVPISPRPIAGLLDYIQYVYIFVVAIPIAFVVFTTKQARRYAFVGLVVVLNGLLIATIVVGILTPDDFNHILLGYGNPNQHYWLIACAFIADSSLALNKQVESIVRAIGVLFALVALSSIVFSVTLTAMLMVVGSIWFSLLWYIRQDERLRARYTRPFWAASAAMVLLALVLIRLNWQFVYSEGSLYARIPQYSAALSTAIEAFPLGTGLASHPVVLASKIQPGRPTAVHNFFLSYFLEIGLAGAIGFVLVLLAWVRQVVMSAYTDRWRSYNLASVLIFAMYILVISLQPVPVHRFWWLVFAFSWGVYHSLRVEEDSRLYHCPSSKYDAVLHRNRLWNR